MIGSLDGLVDFLDVPYVIINVNGVGYRVLVSTNYLSQIKIKDRLKIFTYTFVKEDALDLFGFEKIEDLKLFEKLITVSGVGPKTALSIFSIGDSKQVIDAIIKADLDFFTSVPRLGRKNAQKIIIELKSKLGSIEELDLTDADRKTHSEIQTVLKSFGFTPNEIKDALIHVKKIGDTTEDKIKLALKYLGK